LFKGTLRFNIDPENKHSDAVIDKLLDRTGLKEIMKQDDLQSLRELKIDESGSNLSAGEK